MDYLKKYGVSDENIQNLKAIYNDGIIQFIDENEINIEENIEYLFLEDIKCIYWLMMNNIKIFLEPRTNLEKEIRSLRGKGLSTKEIQMKLLQEN